ncbi:hypothetical protein EMIT0P265_90129 [Pseudomonas zeae]
MCFTAPASSRSRRRRGRDWALRCCLATWPNRIPIWCRCCRMKASSAATGSAPGASCTSRCGCEWSGIMWWGCVRRSRACYADSPANRRSFVGVSLLAIAVCQSTSDSQTYRYREQAHSYREGYKFKVDLYMDIRIFDFPYVLSPFHDHPHRSLQEPRRRNPRPRHAAHRRSR